MFKKYWPVFLALGCLIFGFVLGAYSRSGNEADLTARANDLTKRLAESQAQIITLDGQLASLKTDNQRLADSARLAGKTGVRLAGQIDASLGYLNGTSDDLDRIDAIVRAVQNRSSVGNISP